MIPELPPNHEFMGEIARGRTFAVYKVADRLLNRILALKTVATGEIVSPAASQFLLREARILASLRHPNIVELHAVSAVSSRPYLHMEFVESGSLEDMPWPARQAAQLAESIARALHAVHQRGIVHRNILPSHILLTKEGQPKLIGFGAAALVGQKANTTTTGTPSYAPPEVALGKAEFSPATDVYSLGAVLYELLTGRPPFREETALKTILRVVNGELVPPQRLRPDVPRDLEIICLKCLAKQPGQRYSTAIALTDDLRRFLEEQPSAARLPGILKRGWQRCAALFHRRLSSFSVSCVGSIGKIAGCSGQ